jgi:hypothetical protein
LVYLVGFISGIIVLNIERYKQNPFVRLSVDLPERLCHCGVDFLILYGQAWPIRTIGY